MFRLSVEVSQYITIQKASQSEDINGAKGKQQLQKKSFDKSKKNRKSARKLEKKGFGFTEARGTILDNTASVGEQVCTWMQTTDSGYTTRTKLPNKIVYQFEAGETCKKEVILEGGGFAQKQRIGTKRLGGSVSRGRFVCGTAAEKAMAEPCVDRRQGEIYMVWEVHIITSRVQGIVAKPTRDRVDNEATWKRAIEWMDADLGF
ncbi:unnamed protein product [Porites lobata]|uniref:Uncharacterized protein n=1 Tax=Porites lobata TaxID=104759 RepID=A0ABN8P8V3_9CNID|nr:unnamed protein product [Porites lobata]